MVIRFGKCLFFNLRKPAKEMSSSDSDKISVQDSILADEENYKQTLLTYYRYNHQLPPQREWMKNKFGLRIRDIFDKKTCISVLGVGSGAGDVDIDFLNEIVRCGKERQGEEGYSVIYSVIEPNASNVETFRERVSQNPEYKRIRFNWYNGYFDDFLNDFKKKQPSPDKFDFVHYVRVLYHISGTQVFNETYNHLLTKDGILCAVGENENAFWPKMMHFLAAHKIKHAAFSGSGSVSPMYFLPGWKKHALDRDWKYESYVEAYKFYVTPMFDPNSKDGNYLLDFAFHTKSARTTIEQSIIDDFFKFLNQHKVEEVITEHGAEPKIYCPCELGAIMITKE